MIVNDPNNIFSGLYDPNITNQPAASNLANAIQNLSNKRLTTGVFPGESARWYATFIEHHFPRYTNYIKYEAGYPFYIKVIHGNLPNNH